MEREIERKYRGEVSHSIDIAYGATSLKKDQVSAQRLLELNRNHWEIENRIHYVRDVTYDEDRCRIRTDNGPRIMASIRNIAIGLARLMEFRYIPDANRTFAFNDRKKVLAMWEIN